MTLPSPARGGFEQVAAIIDEAVDGRRRSPARSCWSPSAARCSTTRPSGRAASIPQRTPMARRHGLRPVVAHQAARDHHRRDAAGARRQAAPRGPRHPLHPELRRAREGRASACAICSPTARGCRRGAHSTREVAEAARSRRAPTLASRGAREFVYEQIHRGAPRVPAGLAQPLQRPRLPAAGRAGRAGRRSAARPRLPRAHLPPARAAIDRLRRPRSPAHARARAGGVRDRAHRALPVAREGAVRRGARRQRLGRRAASPATPACSASAADVHALVCRLRACARGEDRSCPPTWCGASGPATAPVPDSTWALGWDTPSATGSSAGIAGEPTRRRPPRLHRDVDLDRPRARRARGLPDQPRASRAATTSASARCARACTTRCGRRSTHEGPSDRRLRRRHERARRAAARGGAHGHRLGRAGLSAGEHPASRARRHRVLGLGAAAPRRGRPRRLRQRGDARQPRGRGGARARAAHDVVPAGARGALPAPSDARWSSPARTARPPRRRCWRSCSSAAAAIPAG